MISVVILTKNEAADLPGCLASVAWSNDVHVFDSFSEDATVSIARAAGATVTQRVFDNYAAQRNASLTLAFRNEWLLILDADERAPPDLQSEMRDFVTNAPAGIAACRMRRRDFLDGRWLRHSQLSPYYIRLVRPACVHYEREVNEVLRVDGAVFDLSHPFDHYPFSKGMTHWIAKHNVYSTMEAEQVMRSRRTETAYSLVRAFAGSDFNERRFHQKGLFYRYCPARPLVKFCFAYFVRAGFLDGRAGFTYALLQAIYEYMIVLKVRERERLAA